MRRLSTPLPLLFVALAVVLAACSQGGGPVPDTTFTVEQLQDPETCKDCHPKQYQEWSGSMHAYASDDPLFAALNRRGQKEAQIGKFCVKCHAPMAVALNLTEDGLNLPSVPKKFRGITCYFCHAVDDVRDSHNNPLHLAGDVIMRGEYDDPVKNKAHRSAYSVFHDRDRTESAGMCGSCHDIVNDHGTHIERTFAEWQESVFGKPVIGSTCSQCHMYDRKNQPIAEGPNVTGTGVFSRVRHDHSFPGVDIALTDWPELVAQKLAVQAFLDTELQTAICVRGFGMGDASLLVVVDNVAGGHKWPSGASQDRRAWFEVTAYKAGSQIYQSGAVPPGTEPTTLMDDDFWVLRDCMFDAAGKETHNFWEAASFESNQLPGQLTFNQADINYYKSHIWQQFPRSPGTKLSDYPDRATLSAQIQAFPLDLFDELFANPADEGFTTDQVQQMRAKLAPFTVGKVVEWTSAVLNDQPTYLDSPGNVPVRCVTATNINAAAMKEPATPRVMCKP